MSDVICDKIAIHSYRIRCGTKFRPVPNCATTGQPAPLRRRSKKTRRLKKLSHPVQFLVQAMPATVEINKRMRLRGDLIRLYLAVKEFGRDQRTTLAGGRALRGPRHDRLRKPEAHHQTARECRRLGAVIRPRYSNDAVASHNAHVSSSRRRFIPASPVRLDGRPPPKAVGPPEIPISYWSRPPPPRHHCVNALDI